MPEVTLKKQMKVIELYLGGLSYDEIARRVSAGKGSVVKVINDLRAGRYTEWSGIMGELDFLRETAVRLNKEGMTPNKAALGLAAWEAINSMGVSPEDVPKAIALLKTLAPGETDQGQFVRAALYLWDLRQKTGMDAEELQKWVVGLEERSKKAATVASAVEALDNQRRSLLEQKALLKKISVLGAGACKPCPKLRARSRIR